MLYDKAFFDLLRPGVKRSATALVPILVDKLGEAIDEKTVIDIGCGEGHWGNEFTRWSFDAVGVDTANERAEIEILDHDLEQRLPLMGPYGLVLCLEVAEHLSPERGPSFIADLCRLSDLIVFSAAIPGQGGVHHINERWPDYWVSLFRKNGYACSGAVRWMIWNDERIEYWYRQNLLIAARYPDRLPNLFATSLATVFDVVHRELWMSAMRPADKSSPRCRVTHVSHEFLSDTRMIGGYLDSPKVGDESYNGGLEILGWALLRVPQTEVPVTVGMAGPQQRCTRISRPDVAAAFPDVAGALESGFRAFVDLADPPKTAEILVQVVVDGGESITLGIVTTEAIPIS